MDRSIQGHHDPPPGALGKVDCRTFCWTLSGSVEAHLLASTEFTVACTRPLQVGSEEPWASTSAFSAQSTLADRSLALPLRAWANFLTWPSPVRQSRWAE